MAAILNFVIYWPILLKFGIDIMWRLLTPGNSSISNFINYDCSRQCSVRITSVPREGPEVSLHDIVLISSSHKWAKPLNTSHEESGVWVSFPRDHDLLKNFGYVSLTVVCNASAN